MPTTTSPDRRKPMAILDLRLHHPKQDPAVFCERLGLRPHISWVAGAQRKTPKGAPLKGVRRPKRGGPACIRSAGRTGAPPSGSGTGHLSMEAQGTAGQARLI